MDGHVDIRSGLVGAVGWKNLDELREISIASGCTPAQFANAVETVGPNPQRVAKYLQRHRFIAAVGGYGQPRV
jgi:hypothetical protein